MVTVEIKKFLFVNKSNVHDRFKSKMGLITLHFEDIIKNIASMEDIIEYISILEWDLIGILALYRNKNQIFPKFWKNAHENNIVRMITNIYKQKEYITIPARSHRVISVILDSNDEQLCLAKEIKKGVFVGNILMKPVNNIGVIHILNTNSTEIHLNSIELNISPVNNYSILNFSINTNDNTARNTKLFEQIDFNNLNQEETMSLKNILEKYNSIFYLNGDTLSNTNTISHRIQLLPGSRPANCKQYRLPLSQREEINKQIKQMLHDEIISPASSAFNAPLLLVPKKSSTDEKKFRLVIDYRKLNEISVGDSFPMPSITELLDNLGHSHYFSTLDMASGYHQIMVDPEDRHMTAFSAGTNNMLGENLGQQYQFNRLPFGLKNAPATFNRLMRTAMCGLEGVSCLIFLDDILIHSHNLPEHIKKLEQVFDRLTQHNLKLQPEKCKFMQKQVVYLGHLISQSGIKPDPTKVIAVTHFPCPKTQKNIKSFLGLVGYYRKFIFNFAEIAKPLTLLLKKNTDFNWDEKCNLAFETLKSAITSEPILQHPDFSKKFILTTDASGFAISGILSQGEIGHDLPIAFISRTLQPAETRYSTTEREMLAIYWSIKQLRPYLLGTSFIAVCDHRPLQYIFKVKDSFSRIFRWRLYLSDYDFVVVYKAGKYNSNADALSRNVACQVLTRAAARKQKECDEGKNQSVNNPKSDVSEEKSYDNFIKNSYKYSKNYKNVLEFNISRKQARENELYLTSINYIDTVDLDLTQIGENLYVYEHDSKVIFYLSITNNASNSFDYKYLYETLIYLKTYLCENNIKSVSYVKSNKLFNQSNYTYFKQIIRYIFEDTDISFVIYIDSIVKLTDKTEIESVIFEFHNSLTGGHIGIKKTIGRLKEIYSWPNMKRDIERYIKNCESCQKNKITKKTKMPMVITSTSNKSGEKWALDIVGPMPLTVDGFQYILTCQDDLSRYLVAIPLKDQESETIARALTDHIILKFGCPKSILTDNGQNFVSNLMKKICKLLQIKKIHTSVYHPQSNYLERSHRTLKEYLRSYVNKHLNDWNNYIQFAVFTYNTTPHATTNYSPHELLFGEKADLPSTIRKEPDPIYNYDDYYFELKYKLQNAYDFAKKNLIKKKEENKKQYDKKVSTIKLAVGDKVLLENVTTKKLESRYLGPYDVIEIMSETNTKIKINNNKYKTVHNNQLKKFCNNSTID